MPIAIAFARVSIHTRTKGHSSVAGSAYRAGDRRIDLRTGEVHDYRNRTDVTHTEILLPENSDRKFLDGAVLWNSVENIEKRKDAQVAKDIVLALPKELSLEQQTALAKDFANYYFVSKGIPVELAVHDHNDGNPHAHLYVTTRRLINDKFDGYKARDLNPTFANSNGKQFVSEGDYWGDKWRQFQTNFFQLHRIDLQVDENLLVSTRHEGRIKNSAEIHYLKQDNQLKREKTKKIIANDTDKLIRLISNRYAVFSEQKLEDFFRKALSINQVNNQELVLELIKFKSHKDVINLGIGEDGQLHYTTRQNFKKESTLVRQSYQLSNTKNLSVKRKTVEKKLAGSSLTLEQLSAVKAITSGKDIAIVVGRAGTGKSYMLNSANSLWQKNGFTVHGISVSGVAAKNLQESSNIKSSTLARFKLMVEHGHTVLDDKSIIVMDEAGMTNLHDMAFVVDAVKKAKAKLVLIGDPEQLQPINAGAPLRALIERIGFTMMENIQRQKDKGDIKASIALARGNVSTALDHYKNKGQLHWPDDPAMTPQLITVNYVKHLENNSSALFGSVVFALQNTVVDEINESIHNKLKKNGFIDNKEHVFTVERKMPNEYTGEIETNRQNKAFSIGDKLLFRSNNTSLGINNGEFALIKSIESNKITVEHKDKKVTTFDPTVYREFDHGYAITVHKSQSLTIDHAYVYFVGQRWNKHLAYVALTRHRESVHLYVNKWSFKQEEKLHEHLSRKAVPDNVLDWPLNFAKHRGFDDENLFKRLLNHLGDWTKNIKSPWELKAALPQKPVDAKNFDWLSSKYQKEWKKLSSINDSTVKLLLRLVAVGRKEKNENERLRINNSISELMRKIVSQPKVFNSVQLIIPRFANTITINTRNIVNMKSIEKEY